MSANKLFGALSFMLAVAIVSTANAQERQTPRPVDDNRGYTYEFVDDPLAAGGFNPHESTITLPRRTVRGTLIRPRTNFIPQLLKSVESI